MDVITMRLGKTDLPSSSQLTDMTKEIEPSGSFSLVAVKCEVEVSWRVALLYVRFSTGLKNFLYQKAFVSA
jgi:hypothetical protein